MWGSKGENVTTSVSVAVDYWTEHNLSRVVCGDVKPQLHIHDSGYDSSRFDLHCKIGVYLDGEKKQQQKNPKSLRCLTMFLWCLYGSFTNPRRFMAAALRMRPMLLRFNTRLVR